MGWRKKHVFLEHTEELTQAERLFKVFGNAREVVRCLRDVGKPRAPATIYKWNYPKERGGTGGLIPTSAWNDLLLAARYAGVFLGPEIFDVRGSAKLKKHIAAVVFPDGRAYAMDAWKRQAKREIQKKRLAKRARKNERVERDGQKPQYPNESAEHALDDDIFS